MKKKFKRSFEIKFYDLPEEKDKYLTTHTSKNIPKKTEEAIVKFVKLILSGSIDKEAISILAEAKNYSETMGAVKSI